MENKNHTTAEINFDLNSYCRVVLNKMNNQFTSNEFHKYLNKIKLHRDVNQIDRVFNFLMQNTKRIGRARWIKNEAIVSKELDNINVTISEPNNKIKEYIGYLKANGYKVMKQKIDWTEC